VAAKADQAVVAATLDDLLERFARIAAPAQRHLAGTTPPELSDDFLPSLSEKSAGGRLRFTEPRAVLTSDVGAEVAHLFDLFVGGAVAEETEVRRTRLKTQLKKFLHDARLLADPSTQETGLSADAEVKGGYSGVKHTVDFASMNGRLVVVETADLTKATRECERQAYEAAAKLNDLRQGWKKRFDGFSVVVLPKGGDKEVLPLKKLLGAYSNLVSFDDERQRGKFRSEVEHSLGRRRLVT
jgi:hypothetical protein